MPNTCPLLTSGHSTPTRDLNRSIAAAVDGLLDVPQHLGRHFADDQRARMMQQLLVRRIAGCKIGNVGERAEIALAFGHVVRVGRALDARAVDDTDHAGVADDFRGPSRDVMRDLREGVMDQAGRRNIGEQRQPPFGNLAVGDVERHASHADRPSRIVLDDDRSREHRSNPAVLGDPPELVLALDTRGEALGGGTGSRLPFLGRHYLQPEVGRRCPFVRRVAQHLLDVAADVIDLLPLGIGLTPRFPDDTGDTGDDFLESRAFALDLELLRLRRGDRPLQPAPGLAHPIGDHGGDRGGDDEQDDRHALGHGWCAENGGPEKVTCRAPR